MNQKPNNNFKINGTVRARIYECYSQGLGLSSTSVIFADVPFSYIQNLFLDFDRKKKAISNNVGSSWIELKQPTSNFVLLTDNQNVLEAYNAMINNKNTDEQPIRS